jgi:hypothetical protein
LKAQLMHKAAENPVTKEFAAEKTKILGEN